MLAETFEDPFGWFNKQVIHRQLGNAVMDSASVFATRRNKAAETAALVRAETGVDENVFVIGLASGGIISAARTFLELGEGDHGLAYVKYSRYKNKDKEPNLYPYPENKKDMFRDMAEGRQVVVYDEDYTSGKTLKTAVGYFANLLSTEVVGVAPVEVERRISYKPLIVKSVQL